MSALCSHILQHETTEGRCIQFFFYFIPLLLHQHPPATVAIPACNCTHDIAAAGGAACGTVVAVAAAAAGAAVHTLEIREAAAAAAPKDRFLCSRLSQDSRRICRFV